jgi:ABC-2 type transport system ATP-binding protein
MLQEQSIQRQDAASATLPPAIQVEDLVKRYPKRPVNAVDGITFHVDRGEVFGLLGPNGAGKTTTIGILTTRVRATSGRAEIAGVDVLRHGVQAKRHIAVVPQNNNLDRSLSARQNLLFHAAYFGMGKREREQRADQLLEEFGLGDRGGDKVDRYSGGMAQRLMIARALMHDPDVLFLDEPTTGLDPQARLFVWDRIRDLHSRGLTVLLTTHDMDEAETLCARVAIMDHGRILALDTPEALKSLVPGASALTLRVAFPGDPAATSESPIFLDLVGVLEGVPGVERVEIVAPEGASAGPPQGASPPWGGPPAAPDGDADEGLAVRIYSERAGAMIAPVSQLVLEHSAEVRDLRLTRASLEDVFIHLTGRGLR